MLIIWDNDGTITNNKAQYIKYYNDLAVHLGMDAVLSEKIIKTALNGPVIPDAYLKMGFNWDKFQANIWEFYKGYNHSASIVPGIDKVIKKLSANFIQTIASSNSEKKIRKSLGDLSGMFKEIATFEHVGEDKIKPHPAVIEYILEKTQTRPENAVYIGDLSSDVEACNNVAKNYDQKVPCIGVTWGMGFGKDLLDAGAVRVVNSVDEIIPAIQEVFPSVTLL